MKESNVLLRVIRHKNIGFSKFVCPPTIKVVRPRQRAFQPNNEHNDNNNLSIHYRKII